MSAQLEFIRPAQSDTNSNLQVYEIMMKAFCTTAQREREFLLKHSDFFKNKLVNMQLDKKCLELKEKQEQLINKNEQLEKEKQQIINKNEQLEKEKQQIINKNEQLENTQNKLLADFKDFAVQFTDLKPLINDLIEKFKSKLSELKEIVNKHSTESCNQFSSQIKEMKDQIDQKDQELHNKDNTFQQLLTENNFLSIQVKEKNEEIRLQREIIAKQMTIAKKENEKQIANLTALHKEEIDNLILLMSEKES